MNTYYLYRRWASGIVREPATKAMIKSDIKLKIDDHVTYNNSVTIYLVVDITDYTITLSFVPPDAPNTITAKPVEYVNNYKFKNVSMNNMEVRRCKQEQIK